MHEKLCRKDFRERVSGRKRRIHLVVCNEGTSTLRGQERFVHYKLDIRVPSWFKVRAVGRGQDGTSTKNPRVQLGRKGSSPRICTVVGASEQLRHVEVADGCCIRENRQRAYNCQYETPESPRRHSCRCVPWAQKPRIMRQNSRITRQSVQEIKRCRETVSKLKMLHSLYSIEGVELRRRVSIPSDFVASLSSQPRLNLCISCQRVSRFK
mmetsp:Transcript_21131/g.35294  ORF Transcript_21131/g.35294 Transcript_21131/m.35294 type:complete len:210 (+) Transcript_21131:334-963(+)